jgi:hypothetical protein
MIELTMARPVIMPSKSVVNTGSMIWGGRMKAFTLSSEIITEVNTVANVCLNGMIINNK